MKRSIILAAAAIALTVISSCGGNGSMTQNNGSNKSEGNSSMCQFDNIKQERMMRYTGEEGDTFYIDNKFTAFWPTLINGKPCPELQQALLQALTDSAELNTIGLTTEYLLKPSEYLELDSVALQPVDAIKGEDGKISTSEVRVRLQDMGDRLMTYHISTYDYLTGGAHGIYSNRYVTYDLKTGKAVKMSDIIADTTLLRSVILTSIKQTYDYTEEDLILPENGLLPLPTEFMIDGSVFHACYQVYDIASYAQGAIDAPIYPYMLKPEEMKRLYTPYGLELIDYSE